MDGGLEDKTFAPGYGELSPAASTSRSPCQPTRLPGHCQANSN